VDTARPGAPALRVSPAAVIRRVRRLPLSGTVLVSPGDRVAPEDVVARSELPGEPVTLDLCRALGLAPADVPAGLRVQPGDRVAAGQVLATARGLFGLGLREVASPLDGTVELVSPLTGQITLRGAPMPVEVCAHVAGRVCEVLPAEGAVIETVGALIQGIFGVGGEARGRLRLAAGGPGDVLDAVESGPGAAGAVLVGGALATRRGLATAAAAGVAGLVVGGVSDADLSAFLGRDLGASATGQEAVPFPVILTEGFGRMAMAERTFRLLASLEGREASISGATQIRAGVQRPEVIVPDVGAGAGAGPAAPAAGNPMAQALCPGALVRLVREPHFGAVARVVALPAEPQAIETEARVRVLRALLPGAGEGEVTVPRNNVELVEG
jgi:hypothetical protein